MSTNLNGSFNRCNVHVRITYTLLGVYPEGSWRWWWQEEICFVAGEAKINKGFLLNISISQSEKLTEHFWCSFSDLISNKEVYVHPQSMWVWMQQNMFVWCKLFTFPLEKADVSLLWLERTSILDFCAQVHWKHVLNIFSSAFIYLFFLNKRLVATLSAAEWCQENGEWLQGK